MLPATWTDAAGAGLVEAAGAGRLELETGRGGRWQASCAELRELRELRGVFQRRHLSSPDQPKAERMKTVVLVGRMRAGLLLMAAAAPLYRRPHSQGEKDPAPVQLSALRSRHAGSHASTAAQGSAGQRTAPRRTAPPPCTPMHRPAQPRPPPALTPPRTAKTAAGATAGPLL